MSIIGKEMSDYLLFNKKSKNLIYGSGTPTCSLMARKEVFKKVGDFDPNLSRQEDIDFAIRLGFMGGHFIGIGQKVIKQYVTKSDQKSPKIEFYNSIKIIKKNSKYLIEKKYYQYTMKWTKLRYFHFSRKYIMELITLLEMTLRFPKRTFHGVVSSGIKRIIHEFKINF